MQYFSISLFSGCSTLVLPCLVDVVLKYCLDVLSARTACSRYKAGQVAPLPQIQEGWIEGHKEMVLTNHKGWRRRKELLMP